MSSVAAGAGDIANLNRVETADYVDMLRRMHRALGRRVAAGDMVNLADMIRLADDLADLTAATVKQVHDTGDWSWADIGDAAGITRQAAQQRWGGRHGTAD